jgi:histidine ammonia-lyase
MAQNAATIVAIELLAAAQGVDMRLPLVTSAALRPIHAEIRARSAFLNQDRSLAPDIVATAGLIASGWFRHRIPVSLASD